MSELLIDHLIGKLEVPCSNTQLSPKFPVGQLISTSDRSCGNYSEIPKILPLSRNNLSDVLCTNYWIRNLGSLDDYLQKSFKDVPRISRSIIRNIPIRESINTSETFVVCDNNDRSWNVVELNKQFRKISRWTKHWYKRWI